MTDANDTYECRVCGNDVATDDDGYAICHGTTPGPPHRKVVVARPCAMCGDPIRTAEVCASCAEDNEPFPDVDPTYLPPVPTRRRRRGRW